jgi:hypothetical protein
MIDVEERIEPHTADIVEMDPPRPADALPPGTRVEVRKRFDQSWARGFEVIDLTDGGYRLRRLSDGNELPLAFTADDVRREKRRDDMWWY